VLAVADLSCQYPFPIRREIFAIAIAQADGIGAIRLAKIDGAMLSRASKQFAQQDPLSVGRERLRR